MDKSQMLVAEEVAKKFKLSKAAVYAKAKRGEIPCRRFGRTVRFHPDEIDPLVGKQTKK
jgi:excisionase family DNA binding protein